MPEFEEDLRKLAQKYSLLRVEQAVEALRIKPGQKFFPTPDEIAEEMEIQRERRYAERQAHETRDRFKLEEEYAAHLRNDPAETAWRIEHFGYDVLRFKSAEEAKNAKD